MRLTRLQMVAAVWFPAMGGSVALALDPLGAPKAGLAAGQFQAGADLLYGAVDFDIHEKTWQGDPAGDISGRYLIKRRGQATDKLYANVGYGLLPNCQAFLRLGGADTGVANDTWLAVGGGTKVTFYETGKWTFGGILQASWAGSDQEETEGYDGFSISSRYHYSVTEVQGALGACYQLNPTLSLYGGPLAHFVRGTTKYTIGYSSTRKDDIREAARFGGYLGAQAQIQANTMVSLEYQRVGHSDAFAIGAVHRFGKP